MKLRECHARRWLQEKSAVELALRVAREEHEDAAAETLRETLERADDQEAYWRDKLYAAERAREQVQVSY